MEIIKSDENIDCLLKNNYYKVVSNYPANPGAKIMYFIPLQ